MAEQETIFDRWAKERNITVEEMKAILSARIEQGLTDPDPEKRAQWEKISHAGEIPTPEEWIRYPAGAYQSRRHLPPFSFVRMRHCSCTSL